MSRREKIMDAGAGRERKQKPVVHRLDRHFREYFKSRKKANAAFPDIGGAVALSILRGVFHRIDWRDQANADLTVRDAIRSYKSSYGSRARNIPGVEFRMEGAAQKLFTEAGR